jgi:hypothetical protein
MKVAPLPGVPAMPSPYVLLLLLLISASCICMTSSMSPAAIGVPVAPRIVFESTVIEVASTAAVPTPG